MDSRLLAIGLGDIGLFSLGWEAYPFLTNAPYSFGSTWGVAVEGLFTATGLTLVVAGLVRHGSMKERIADWFMVASLVLGICTFVFLGFILGLGYQESLSMCADIATQNSCLAGQAQFREGAVFSVNLFTLVITFLGSYNWVRKLESNPSETSTTAGAVFGGLQK